MNFQNAVTYACITTVQGMLVLGGTVGYYELVRIPAQTPIVSVPENLLCPRKEAEPIEPVVEGVAPTLEEATSTFFEKSLEVVNEERER